MPYISPEVATVNNVSTRNFATMPDPISRPYHHGDLRRAVIETAQDMLREEKDWQFTLREVARRAGVSHAAPYKHFHDKSALLAELAKLGFVELAATLNGATPKNTASLRDEVVPIAQAYIAFAMQNPALYRLMFSAEEGRSTGLHLSDSALSVFEVTVELLRRGQAAGLIRNRPIQGQAATCWALLHGIAMLAIDGLLVPDKVGPNPLQAALDTLIEGLAVEQGD